MKHPQMVRIQEQWQLAGIMSSKWDYSKEEIEDMIIWKIEKKIKKSKLSLAIKLIQLETRDINVKPALTRLPLWKS